MGGWEVATGGVENWKRSREDWHLLPNDPPVSHQHPFATLRHPTPPASTNKHGMHYIKEPQISKAPPRVILERDVAR